MPMDMVMAAVLHYAAEASEILAFLMLLPGACVAARKWAQERRPLPPSRWMAPPNGATDVTEVGPEYGRKGP